MAETKRMTAEQVVSYLLEEDGLDFLRESLTWVVQQLMEAEVSELVGAARGGLGDDLPVNLRGRPCRSVADRRRSQKLAIIDSVSGDGYAPSSSASSRRHRSYTCSASARLPAAA